MNTKQAAMGRWPEIFEYYGLPPVTGKNHFRGECPLCGKKGKYRCDDKGGSGSYICTCGSGDGWALLAGFTGKEFKVLAHEVDQLIGNTFTPGHDSIPKARSPIATQRLTVSRKFASLVPLRGTSAEGYLKNRGINALPAEQVRYCNKQRAAGREFQSMYALATDDKGELCYLHRTLLDGDRKAHTGGAAKKLMKLQEDSYLDHARSVAIRMFPSASTLGIAEGIETALACHQITGCHTWATLNTTFMKKFRVPKGVTHLIIFADADDNAAGHAAAFECASANLHAKNDLEMVSIRWPERGDFNDVLLNGMDVYELTFPPRGSRH
ncbi:MULTISPECIES: toprim domain-containing protein [Pantoea]|uniref:DNA primase n=1 Tax=Candidatus Pantoea gossypiicola TaxID=2608008 RepID=A0AB34CQR9_9GAMM|nr:MULTISPECIES: toprim domain-containing protein [Pantoea]KAA5961036.1 DNA primase [Pantoea sp. VH_24]KAA5964423.1 DNA primase [Pantoea sp. VH_16]KAA5968639.1 DNA primase [Pantoea sp. VH_18]KAA6004294.1 DNA primase [Pantoea sp. M_1]KAA6006778.1 DNA primase [Pantoea sp. F_7]